MIMSPGLLKYISFFLFICTFLYADPIAKNYAKLKLLDKITNRVNEKNILANSVVEWDYLTIKIYACLSSPPEEIPENYVLIEVKDRLKTSNEYIYRGWMISSAPDVTPLEHPIYDLWLIECT